MEIPDDCINLIKEYSGITSLDIINCYRSLKQSINPKINCHFGYPFSIKTVQYLLELLPFLVKTSKKQIDYDKKAHINEHIEHGYATRQEIIVAMKLAGYPMLENGFQADFINQVQLTRGLKKIHKFKTPAYKLEFKTYEYLPILTYIVWNRTPFLRNHSKFQKIKENKETHIRCLNYDWISETKGTIYHNKG